MIIKRNWKPFKKASRYSREIGLLVQAMREVPFNEKFSRDVDEIVGRELTMEERSILFSRSLEYVALMYGVNLEKQSHRVGEYRRVADIDISDFEFGTLVQRMPKEMRAT